MIKNLRKNKKGFTLIEIIVVLVIMGILLAIAVPAILGYVSKATDAKYLAQARGGYMAAQTLTASNKSKNTTTTSAMLNAAELNKELGIAETDDGGVTAAYCTVTTDAKNVTACNIIVKGMETGKYVNFTPDEAKVVKGTVDDGVKVTPAP